MTWRFADARIESDVPFPVLPVDRGPADIRITRGSTSRTGDAWSPLQTWMDDVAGAPWATIERGSGGYRLTFTGLRVVIAAGGTHVVYEPGDGCTPSLLAHLLLHQVLPLCLSRRGRLVLHACAVATPRGVIAIVGESGAGKSTLAAAFCAAGASLVADDALVVDFGEAPGDRVARAIPAADGLRLWNDVAVPLPSGATITSTGAPSDAKQHVVVPLATEWAPIVRMLLIGPIDDTGTHLTDVPPEAARVALLPHLFRLDVTDAVESRRLFDAVHRLALSVPARALVFPNGPEHLPLAVAAALRDLEP